MTLNPKNPNPKGGAPWGLYSWVAEGMAVGRAGSVGRGRVGQRPERAGCQAKAVRALPTAAACLPLAPLLCLRRRRTTKHTAAHLQAQLPCLSTPQGGWAVDFIGRVENIHSDLDALIAALDARGLESVPQLGPRKSKLLNINGQPCHPQDGELGSLPVQLQLLLLHSAHALQLVDGRLARGRRLLWEAAT